MSVPRPAMFVAIVTRPRCPAWAMLRYNPWARAAYARLTRGGLTRKKPAVVALARRLLVRCWAMLRDGLPWRAEAQPVAP